MALGTVTPVKSGVIGDLRYSIVDVNPTSGANYTTGGEPFAAAQVTGNAWGQLLGVKTIGDGSVNANAGSVRWDQINKKLMVFKAVDATTVGMAEAASNSDFSAAGAKVRLLCLLK